MPNGANSVSSTLSHNYPRDPQTHALIVQGATVDDMFQKQHDYYNNIHLFSNQNSTEYVDDSLSASWEFPREK
jgi:hypothetical protein